MKLFVFFGLPGAGKTFAGKVAQKYFDYHFYDGDNDLTPQLHEAFQNSTIVTDDMRDAFFYNLTKSVKRLMQQYDKLIVSQTFIKEKYRKQFLDVFPSAKFVLIQAPEELREKITIQVKEYTLDAEYVKKMAAIFESAHIPHEVLRNDFVGEEKIKEQLQKILD